MSWTLTYIMKSTHTHILITELCVRLPFNKHIDRTQNLKKHIKKKIFWNNERQNYQNLDSLSPCSYAYSHTHARKHTYVTFFPYTQVLSNWLTYSIHKDGELKAIICRHSVHIQPCTIAQEDRISWFHCIHAIQKTIEPNFLFICNRLIAAYWILMPAENN